MSNEVIYIYYLLISFSTNQLVKIGRKLLGNKFIGVFPLDKLPKYLKNGAYIINTQSSNLPGEHWLAFVIKQHAIEVFDSFGYYYPTLLVNKLQRLKRNISYNRRQYQLHNETTCGQFCIVWLYNQFY